jgi:hypothetical protein
MGSQINPTELSFKVTFYRLSDGTKRFLRTAAILGMILLLAVPTEACSGSANLNRTTARKLIQESDKFGAQVTLDLRAEDDIRLFPESPEEDEEGVRARVLRNYYSSYPAMAVLKHLGYMYAVATVVKPYEVKYNTAFPTKSPWVFKIDPALTEKGKELARSQGVKGERSLLVARREVIEVTGIRERQGQAAAVFTWKAIPTEVGKIFDPSSDTFKSLPQELRGKLSETRGIGPFGGNSTQDWNQTYKATANFQKYDDGWRVTSITSGAF